MKVTFEEKQKFIGLINGKEVTTEVVFTAVQDIFESTTFRTGMLDAIGEDYMNKIIDQVQSDYDTADTLAAFDKIIDDYIKYPFDLLKIIGLLN